MPAVTNSFRPTALSFNSYGWKGSPLYNRADVPTRWVEGATSADRTVIEQQLAYEWLDSAEGGGVGTGGVISTNPPFLSRAAGEIIPGMTSDSGHSPRILRGFIRRAEADWSDPTAMARLYFMFNPEQIQRDYVSYLDQGALDPFNTVYQSGNLVAPPSYMDFTFSLFFDRQEEATDPKHPGVFVDYQYFDLVVRNVVPASDPNSMNNTLPDNGVMMVNPRDITVVFSPQITVQGRPSNARVSFERFTHRMTPTRMRIDLTMRVVYFGPMKDMTTYVKQEETVAATIPWTQSEDAIFNVTNEDVAKWQNEFGAWATAFIDTGGDVTQTAVDQAISEQVNNSAVGSGNAMTDIVEFGKRMVSQSGTDYTYSRAPLWRNADCSELVWGCFANHEPAMAYAMRWPLWKMDKPNGSQAPSAAEMHRMCKDGTSPVVRRWDVVDSAQSSKSSAAPQGLVQPVLASLRQGDILFRVRQPGTGPSSSGSSGNHVAFFDSWVGTPGQSKWRVFHAGSPQHVGVYERDISFLWTGYNACYTPNISGAYQVALQQMGN